MKTHKWIPFLSAFFLTALLALCACSTDGDDIDQEKHYNSTSDHKSYQVGFDDVESAEIFENNDYAAIVMRDTWRQSWAVIPSVVKRPDAQQLLYSYNTGHGLSFKYYSFYAYYSAIVEWDEHIEYKEYGGIIEAKTVQENLKCTERLLAYTTGTPSEYIPKDTSPKVTTYPKCESAWSTISSNPNPGGTPPSGGSSGGLNSGKEREYSYHCTTNSYKKTGELDDKLYIYKKGSDYRASWSYYAKGLDKNATMTIHFDPTTIGGTQFSYKIIPYGLSFYFNFKK